MGLDGQAFDEARAMAYGRLINFVYDVYDALSKKDKKTNPAPTLPPLPDGLEFVAYVQMRDRATAPLEFYGLLAKSNDVPSRHIMAIRGTRGLAEWIDDLRAARLEPWDGPGDVGEGFNRIYRTMLLVTPSLGGAAAPLGADGNPTESFAKQVAKTVHAVRNRGFREAAAPSEPIDVEVCGHSLGSALATLYAAHNAAPKGDVPGFGYDIRTPVLYTFASPRVGSDSFAAAFDDLPVTSWRIVNSKDLVPKLPIFGFKHVDMPKGYDSGWATRQTLECWHSLYTYMHLIDATSLLKKSCIPLWTEAGDAAIPGLPPADLSEEAPAAEPAVTVRASPAATSKAGDAISVTVTITGLGRV